jgi:hypothetical protein
MSGLLMLVVPSIAAVAMLRLPPTLTVPRPRRPAARHRLATA